MATLSDETIATLLAPYVSEPVPQDLYSRIGRFLDLLLLWNGRTNLTAVRNAEDVVQRQIGESLFSAQLMPESGTLLDFGSGAGFPGVPLGLLRPGLTVTLAESQGKKASFLREVSRVLELPVAVWARRVEDLPSTQVFDAVTMRAVDRTAAMLAVAASRVAPSGRLVRFLSSGEDAAMPGWDVAQGVRIPQSPGQVVSLKRI